MVRKGLFVREKWGESVQNMWEKIKLAIVAISQNLMGVGEISHLRFIRQMQHCTEEE